jgi:hypothetical protein
MRRNRSRINSSDTLEEMFTGMMIRLIHHPAEERQEVRVNLLYLALQF